MSPRTSFVEIHHTAEADFLAELALDVADAAVLEGIVRVSLVWGPGSNPAYGMDALKGRYLEASYVTTREQLVKLSARLGQWADPARPWSYRDFAATSNAALDDAERERAHHLVTALKGMAGIRLRLGSLVVADDTWTAGTYEEIEKPLGVTGEEGVCSCGEPIYFANKLWRHRATKKVAVTRRDSCDRCGGSGKVGPISCKACFGLGAREVVEHGAAPAVEGAIARHE